MKTGRIVSIVVIVASVIVSLTGCPFFTKHTIISSSSPHGIIDPSGEVRVGDGKDETFTMTPDPNCSILDVVVDGDSVGAVSSYTFSDVTADHTIYATFSIYAGEWSGTATINGSDYPLIATFTQDGSALGGTAELTTMALQYTVDATLSGLEMDGIFIGIDDGGASVYDWDVHGTLDPAGPQIDGTLYIAESGASGTYVLTKL
jgi:hypothetical protein